MDSTYEEEFSGVLEAAVQAGGKASWGTSLGGASLGGAGALRRGGGGSRTSGVGRKSLHKGEVSILGEVVLVEDERSSIRAPGVLPRCQ